MEVRSLLYGRAVAQERPFYLVYDGNPVAVGVRSGPNVTQSLRTLGHAVATDPAVAKAVFDVGVQACEAAKTQLDTTTAQEVSLAEDTLTLIGNVAVLGMLMKDEDHPNLSLLVLDTALQGGVTALEGAAFVTGSPGALIAAGFFKSVDKIVKAAVDAQSVVNAVRKARATK